MHEERDSLKHKVNQQEEELQVLGKSLQQNEKDIKVYTAAANLLKHYIVNAALNFWNQ